MKIKFVKGKVVLACLILCFASITAVAQISVKRMRFDTTGVFNFTLIMGENDSPVISVQRKIGENWVTISEWNQSPPKKREVAYPANSKKPASNSYTLDPILGEALVPVNKGINTYRIKTKNPDFTSHEVSVKRFSPLEKLAAVNDSIHFDNYYNIQVLDGKGTFARIPQKTNILYIGDLKKGLYYIGILHRLSNLPVKQYIFNK